MRLKSSSVFLVIMAALTLSAVQAASASAEMCQKKASSKKWTLCVEDAKTTKASFTLTLKTGTKLSIGPRPGNKSTVTCTQGGGTGAFNKNTEGAAYISSFEIEFKGCELTGADAEQGCKLSRTEIPWGTAGVESSFGPSSGSLTFASSNFGEFDETGTCSNWGIERMSGEQRCTVSEAEVEKTTHTVVCSQEKSLVKGDGGHALPVGFEENVELSGTVSKKPFSIIESA